MPREAYKVVRLRLYVLEDAAGAQSKRGFARRFSTVSFAFELHWIPGLSYLIQVPVYIYEHPSLTFLTREAHYFLGKSHPK